jgi:hypothetical protein
MKAGKMVDDKRRKLSDDFTSFLDKKQRKPSHDKRNNSARLSKRARRLTGRRRDSLTSRRMAWKVC